MSTYAGQDLSHESFFSIKYNAHGHTRGYTSPIAQLLASHLENDCTFAEILFFLVGAGKVTVQLRSHRPQVLLTLSSPQLIAESALSNTP